MVKRKENFILNPASCALLMIDLQNHFAHPNGRSYLPSSSDVISNIFKLFNVWKGLNGILVFTRHCNTVDNLGLMGKFYTDYIKEGEFDSLILEEFGTRADLYTVINKNTYDAFYNTSLESFLKQHNINQVLITGCLTHLCCETTARSAFVRGFEEYFGSDLTFTKNETLQNGTLRAIEDGVGVVMSLEKILISVTNYNGQ